MGALPCAAYTGTTLAPLVQIESLTMVSDFTPAAEFGATNDKRANRL